MHRQGRIAYHLIFIAAIACLIVFKWSDLSLPYFWDELGVYTQAADYQVQHGISLAPASVPPVLSRGHPLLFTCMNAIVRRVFGEQVMVAHVFCFFIAVLLLAVIYLKVSKYFDAKAGLVCAVICMIQPLYLAQSALVLPEMALTLFIFVALCSFYEEKPLGFALFATLAILTKESAIVLPVAVVFYALVQWAVRKERPEALGLKRLVLIFMPYVIFGGFLVLQKIQHGWYFFPYHLEAVTFDIAGFAERARHFLQLVFVQQGRYVLTALAIAGVLISLTLNKRDVRGKQGGFLLLMVLFGLIFLGFNSLFGVYMSRYAAVVVILFCTVAGVAITAVSENGLYLGLVMLGLLLVSRMHQEEVQFNYDEDLGYRRQVKVLQKGVDELMRVVKPGDKIGGNFPGFFALSFDKGGYLNGTKINPDRLTDKDYDYYLLCNPPNTELECDTNKYVVTALKSFSDGYAHAMVYRVKKK